VVVDPNNEITDEITTLNNVAHTALPKKEEAKTEPVIRRSPAAGGR
jgi:hypothetical protein